MNSLVYMATNIHQTVLFASVIHVIPDWHVTSSALDEELVDKVFVTVIQGGLVLGVMYRTVLVFQTVLAVGTAIQPIA